MKIYCFGHISSVNIHKEENIFDRFGCEAAFNQMKDVVKTNTLINVPFLANHIDGLKAIRRHTLANFYHLGRSRAK